MSLLLDEDYDSLSKIGMKFEEDHISRFLVFSEYSLPSGVYNVDTCAVLVVIPSNYNDAGIDMFWTLPKLIRTDCKNIPNIESPGSQNNRHYQGKEYCRWSRHWDKGYNNWKAGISNIDTILRRLRWAFENPDAGQ